MRKERAFLVGLDYRTRKRPSGSNLTSGAQAARDTAVAAKSRPASEPQFTAEESLAELRDLAISAGAEIVGEILQHRDRPDPATLIGRGKLEEIAVEMGLSYENARALHARAFRRLKDLWKKLYGEEDFQI